MEYDKFHVRMENTLPQKSVIAFNVITRKMILFETKKKALDFFNIKSRTFILKYVYNKDRQKKMINGNQGIYLYKGCIIFIYPADIFDFIEKRYFMDVDFIHKKLLEHKSKDVTHDNVDDTSA